MCLAGSRKNVAWQNQAQESKPPHSRPPLSCENTAATRTEAKLNFLEVKPVRPELVDERARDDSSVTERAGPVPAVPVYLIVMRLTNFHLAALSLSQ